MKKRLRLLIYIAISFLIPVILTICRPEYIAAKEMKLKKLIERMKIFDGNQIEIKGEVVGDIMRRKGGLWLNIDDGTESMGVWCPEKILPRIDFIGGYKSKGDIVWIRGTFNNACPLHGGETDIHALEIIRIREGYPLYHPASPERIKWALILLTLAVFITAAYWWKRIQASGAAQTTNGN